MIKSHHKPLLYFQATITVVAYVAMLILLGKHFPYVYSKEKIHVLLVFIIVPLITSIVYFSRKYQHIHLTDSAIIVINAVTGTSKIFDYRDIQSTEIVVNEGNIHSYFEEIFIHFKDGKHIVISADIFSNYLNIKEFILNKLHKEELIEVA